MVIRRHTRTNPSVLLLTSARVFADDRAPTTGTRLPNTQSVVRSVTLPSYEEAHEHQAHTEPRSRHARPRAPTQTRRPSAPQAAPAEVRAIEKRRYSTCTWRARARRRSWIDSVDDVYRGRRDAESRELHELDEVAVLVGGCRSRHRGPNARGCAIADRLRDRRHNRSQHGPVSSRSWIVARPRRPHRRRSDHR